jgi:hypothetical protein
MEEALREAGILEEERACTGEDLSCFDESAWDGVSPATGLRTPADGALVRDSLGRVGAEGRRDTWVSCRILTYCPEERQCTVELHGMAGVAWRGGP